MKQFLLLLITLLLFTNCKKQESVDTSKNDSKPKLVIGIVVDQMRYDYLTRFETKYGDGGFKRMINEGYNCKNNHFNYVPTATGPGHASIYTGTTPKYHGIIGNNWYDKKLKESVYCAGDGSVKPIGTTKNSGRMSPHRMITTTFADENRLFTQMRGKTIGISIKDRGAVLPAGHTANAAYWFEGDKNGNWITSSYYINELPNWVKLFNESDKVESYLKVWDTYYDIETYTESGDDLNTFEGGFDGKETATFPYDLAALKSKNGDFNLLKATPFGNNIITDFALAAIEGEQLGKDNITDVLTISYSSTDYVGHNFGVNSKEIEDTYIRLDKDLERLFNYLDTNIGKGEYTVFLTADHGAIHVPSYLQSVKVSAGYFDSKKIKKKLNSFMKKTYSTSDLIENISNSQVFLNIKKIKKLGLNLESVQKTIVNEIIKYKYVEKAYTATEIRGMSHTNGIEELLQNGYNQKRSGDVIFVMQTAIISYGKTGSTHGTGYNFDTHVPLLFFGGKITHGATYQRTNITDIAPTMSALLGIEFPNGTTGTVIEKVLE